MFKPIGRYSRRISNTMDSDKAGYNPAKTIIFILIAAVIILAGDLILFDGKNLFWQKSNKMTVTAFLDIEELQKRHDQYMKDGILPPHSSRRPVERMAQASMDKELEPFMPIQPFEIPDDTELPHSKPAENTLLSANEIIEPEPEQLQAVEPASGAEEIKSIKKEPEPEITHTETLPNKPVSEEISFKTESQKPNFEGMPKIAIIIDDMGLSLRGRQIEVMSYPLTLSYLPYANNLRERTAIARKHGHELMVHMPMEAMKGENGGPRVLEIGESDAEFKSTVEWGLSQFDGYVGLNNHMGSRLTQDSASMQKLMEILKDKNIYFVDSKTIGSSVAEDFAAKYGLAHAGRDVFLDHEISRSAIDQALNDLIKIAKHKGSAIAIGHPHKETIEALKDWLPTLADKGIELVPVSKLVHKRPVNSGIHLAAQQQKNNEVSLDGEYYNRIEPSTEGNAQ